MKIVVIDRHPLVSIAIKSVLDPNSYTCVAEADNGVDGLEQVRMHRPDLVILDIHLSRLSGFEVMRKIHDIGEPIEILVLTDCPARHYYSRCRAARASAFLAKTCTIEELKDTIGSLMVGHSLTSISLDAAAVTRSSFANEATLIRSLSNRELTTFELLARGMSNKEIAEHLELSNKTISTYKARLLEKLNAFSLVQLLGIARRNGLVSSDAIFPEQCSTQY